MFKTLLILGFLVGCTTTNSQLIDLARIVNEPESTTPTEWVGALCPSERLKVADEDEFKVYWTPTEYQDTHISYVKPQVSDLGYTATVSILSKVTPKAIQRWMTNPVPGREMALSEREALVAERVEGKEEDSTILLAKEAGSWCVLGYRGSDGEDFLIGSSAKAHSEYLKQKAQEEKDKPNIEKIAVEFGETYFQDSSLNLLCDAKGRVTREPASSRDTSLLPMTEFKINHYKSPLSPLWIRNREAVIARERLSCEIDYFFAFSGEVTIHLKCSHGADPFLEEISIEVKKAGEGWCVGGDGYTTLAE